MSNMGFGVGTTPFSTPQPYNLFSPGLVPRSVTSSRRGTPLGPSATHDHRMPPNPSQTGSRSFSGHADPTTQAPPCDSATTNTTTSCGVGVGVGVGEGDEIHAASHPSPFLPSGAAPSVEDVHFLVQVLYQQQLAMQVQLNQICLALQQQQRVLHTLASARPAPPSQSQQPHEQTHWQNLQQQQQREQQRSESCRSNSLMDAHGGGTAATPPRTPQRSDEPPATSRVPATSSSAVATAPHMAPTEDARRSEPITTSPLPTTPRRTPMRVESFHGRTPPLLPSDEPPISPWNPREQRALQQHSGAASLNASSSQLLGSAAGGQWRAPPSPNVSAVLWRNNTAAPDTHSLSEQALPAASAVHAASAHSASRGTARSSSRATASSSSRQQQQHRVVSSGLPSLAYGSDGAVGSAAATSTHDTSADMSSGYARQEDEEEDDEVGSGRIRLSSARNERRPYGTTPPLPGPARLSSTAERPVDRHGGGASAALSTKFDAGGAVADSTTERPRPRCARPFEQQASHSGGGTSASASTSTSTRRRRHQQQQQQQQPLDVSSDGYISYESMQYLRQAGFV